MAPPAGQIRPGRYLTSFLAIVVVLYALVFLGGPPKPRLGIDLQGGTRVTLTARTPDCAVPNDDTLKEATNIIQTRVDGAGVAGVEVLRSGTNLEITAPGATDNAQIRSLGQTAKLSFRSVITTDVVAPPAPPTPGSTAPSTPGSSSSAPPPSSQTSAPKPQGRPAPAAGGQPTTTAPSVPSATGSTPPPASGSQAPPKTVPKPPPGKCEQNQGNVDPKVAAEIAEAKKTRQSEDQQVLQAAFAALTCDPGKKDPLIGNDDPTKPLVACGQKAEKNKDGDPIMYKYLLDKEFLPGTEIDTASSATNPNGAGYVVNLKFKKDGTDIWANYTAQNVGKQVAVVLDTKVVSAPSIRGAIPGGNTEISGDFGQREAKDLAEVLKYGALPLSFETSDAQTVSPTLGSASLQAGLLAGAIGLLLVFVYCLFYYRLLGVLTILSLALSGVLVFSVLVLLGRAIGFSLDIAGIAGFIVAIGITADSFVIFFEMLKDEVREGRTFRSAVPRGWVRARRTILSADAVSFLASAVLYTLAVGQVRGFAFTLGLSTILDLVIVFLVTHPLVAIASNNKTLSSPKFSGLGSVAKMGEAKRAARSVGSKTVKEA